MQQLAAVSGEAPEHPTVIIIQKTCNATTKSVQYAMFMVLILHIIIISTNYC